MRISSIGYGYRNSGWLIEMHDIEYRNWSLCNDISKLKSDGFRLALII